MPVVSFYFVVFICRTLKVRLWKYCLALNRSVGKKKWLGTVAPRDCVCQEAWATALPGSPPVRGSSARAFICKRGRGAERSTPGHCGLPCSVKMKRKKKRVLVKEWMGTRGQHKPSLLQRELRTTPMSALNGCSSFYITMTWLDSYPGSTRSILESLKYLSSLAKWISDSPRFGWGVSHLRGLKSWRMNKSLYANLIDVLPWYCFSKHPARKSGCNTGISRSTSILRVSPILIVNTGGSRTGAEIWLLAASPRSTAPGADCSGPQGCISTTPAALRFASMSLC